VEGIVMATYEKNSSSLNLDPKGALAFLLSLAGQQEDEWLAERPLPDSDRDLRPAGGPSPDLNSVTR
jgi:hypothetical protein